MKSIKGTFNDMFIGQKLSSLFFMGRPSLKDKVKDISIKDGKCDKCGAYMNYFTYTMIMTGDIITEPAYEKCVKCHAINQSIEVSNEINETRKNKLRNKWYKVVHGNAGFKNFDTSLSKAVKDAHKKITEYYINVSNGNHKNLLIMGSTGTGKSHLTSALARSLDAKGLSVGFITSVELFEMIKGTFGSDRDRKLLYSEMRALDVLIIDDVGLETKKMNVDIGWNITEWTEIINNRYGLSTVWTTNFDETSIYKVIGERAVSRMYENAVHINLFTDDYRKRGVKYD